MSKWGRDSSPKNVSRRDDRRPYMSSHHGSGSRNPSKLYDSSTQRRYESHSHHRSSDERSSNRSHHGNRYPERRFESSSNQDRERRFYSDAYTSKDRDDDVRRRHNALRTPGSGMKTGREMLYQNTRLPTGQFIGRSFLDEEKPEDEQETRAGDGADADEFAQMLLMSGPNSNSVLRSLPPLANDGSNRAHVAVPFMNFKKNNTNDAQRSRNEHLTPNIREVHPTRSSNSIVSVNVPSVSCVDPVMVPLPNSDANPNPVNGYNEATQPQLPLPLTNNAAVEPRLQRAAETQRLRSPSIIKEEVIDFSPARPPSHNSFGGSRSSSILGPGAHLTADEAIRIHELRTRLFDVRRFMRVKMAQLSDITQALARTQAELARALADEESIVDSLNSLSRF